MAERSASLSMGLVGVSTQISFVAGVIAASMFFGSRMSTKLKLSPADFARTRANSR